MHETKALTPRQGTITRRTQIHFDRQRQQLWRRSDRMFAWLLGVEWLAAIMAALWLSPRTWMGQSSQFHVHVWAAVLLGGTIVRLPIYLAITRAGFRLTRHAIAAGQMLMSALLIHLTGGRIETHFHVFGSLAFLAFYRDWRVLVTASTVVTIDHWCRGVFWPQSVFGVLMAGPWRWLEHVGWVLFEDVFLIYSCVQSTREMRGIAEREGDLEFAGERLSANPIREQSEVKLAASNEAARQAEEKYRCIFENAAEGIFQTSPDGRYLTANRSLARLYGYKVPAELIATVNNIENQLYVDPSRRAEFMRIMLAHASVTAFESEVFRNDRSQIWISETLSVHDSNGVLLFFEGTVNEITDANGPRSPNSKRRRRPRPPTGPRANSWPT